MRAGLRQPAAVALQTRANKGRHFFPFFPFLPKHQAIGMARVASSDTSAVYCRRVINCQNGLAPSSTNRHETCRRTGTRWQVRNRKKWDPSRRLRPHLPTTLVTITQWVIASVLTSSLGLPAQVIYPAREDRLSAHLGLS